MRREASRAMAEALADKTGQKALELLKSLLDERALRAVLTMQEQCGDGQ